MRAAQGALRGLLSAGSQAGNILTGLSSAKGILDGVVDALKKPITLAADMESMNAEFTTMLGSGAKAKALLGEIRAYGNVTPFGTAGLAGNAKTLLAFGTAGKAIVPTLKMLGDVAGSSQDKLDMLTLAFAQISSSGKLQGQDLLQLINAGFNPLQEIARTTGRSMADLRADMESGAISADMVTSAFRSATSAGGRFFGNTASQGKVFRGLASTMGDAWDEFLRRFGAPIMNALKPGFTEATSLLGKMATLAEKIGSVLANGLTVAIAVIKGGDLGKVLQLSLSIGFKEAVNTFVATWTAGTQSFGPLLQKVLGIGIGFLVGGALPAIGKGFVAGLSAVVAGLAKGVALVMEAFNDPRTMKGFENSFRAVIYGIKAELLDVFGTILESIPGLSKRGEELREGAIGLRGLSTSYGKSARRDFALSNSTIGQAINGIASYIPTNAFDFSEAMKTIKGEAASAGRQFDSVYAQAPKVFDISGDRAALAGTVANDLRKLASKPIPVQIINQNGMNVGGVF